MSQWWMDDSALDDALAQLDAPAAATPVSVLAANSDHGSGDNASQIAPTALNSRARTAKGFLPMMSEPTPIGIRKSIWPIAYEAMTIPTIWRFDPSS